MYCLVHGPKRRRSVAVIDLISIFIEQGSMVPRYYKTHLAKGVSPTAMSSSVERTVNG